MENKNEIVIFVQDTPTFDFFLFIYLFCYKLNWQMTIETGIK